MPSTDYPVHRQYHRSLPRKSSTSSTTLPPPTQLPQPGTYTFPRHYTISTGQLYSGHSRSNTSPEMQTHAQIHRNRNGQESTRSLRSRYPLRYANGKGRDDSHARSTSSNHDTHASIAEHQLGPPSSHVQHVHHYSGRTNTAGGGEGGRGGGQPTPPSYSSIRSTQWDLSGDTRGYGSQPDSLLPTRDIRDYDPVLPASGRPLLEEGYTLDNFQFYMDPSEHSLSDSTQASDISDTTQWKPR